MGYCRLKIIFFSFFITTCFRYSNACGIEGTNPGTPVIGRVRDVDEGTIWRNKTTDVIGINSYSVGGVLEPRGYLSVQLIDSQFELFTTEYFKDYEEFEVAHQMTVSVSYECSGINNLFPQIITINVTDTNNNPPTFLPSNEYVFKIAAPMPPGYEITGCLDSIIVRDIDLTTQKIIFKIEDNPYFEIEEEIHRNSSTPKEFKTILRTKNFIRSFPEELKLSIWATDSDLTGDPQRTKEATITFLGNTDFVLPEEPVFSETFYLADYTDDNRVVLTEPITLKSGYDKLVQFNIRGDYSNFKLVHDEENKISIRVVKELAEEDLKETNIHLIVTADRELTSGASATVVLRLPEVVPLEFQRGHYKGQIEDNNLRAPQLILSQGYEDTSVYATVLNGSYISGSSYFSANVEGNTITLSMTSLQESIILDNNFLNLEIFATNGRSNATTIVTLEIIKDDNVTPVFNKPIYIGSYSPTGLILEKIELVQGYDEINSVDLHGDDKKYFRAVLSGATVTIEAETIPPEIYSQERIVLTLEVMKPRTVGASSTIIINLPAARVLEFEASTHRGSLQNNALTLDPIRLTVGYDSSVVFTVTGDFAKYFQVTNGQNPAFITLKPDIPSDVILNNNVIFLTLVASGLNAVTTTTSVILDIIKDDTTTPVFSSNIYYGTYLDMSNFDIQNIHLTQGSDGDVIFKLDGEHAQYFDYSNKGNDVMVFPRSAIPQDVIFEKKVLVFNILAMKALTVGASAAISIRFPSDLTDQVILSFAQSTYTGTLASNGLAIHDSIKLSAGYALGTEFILTGEFREHFKAEPIDDGLTLTLLDSLPVEARERAFIVLEIEARRERAVSAWTSVVIEVVRQEIVPPVFDQAYYRGAYNAESGLQFTQVISLSQGYDDTVSFTLDGALISLFHLSQTGSNSFVISAQNPIPSDVLQAHSQFLFAVVATKPGAALVARSAVSIDIEKDLTDRVVLMFAKSTYTGTLASNGLAIDDSIKLSAGYAPGTAFILTGEFSEHFKAEPIEDGLTLTLLDSLPVEARERAFIVLDIEATRERAVSAWTSVVIEVVRQEIVPPVFDQTYYRGAYNAESGLQFTQVISLSQGYDDTVSFTLEGALISLFHLSQTGSNSFVISAQNPIPSDVLQAHSQFLFAVVATKPGAALVARSAVSIDIEKDLTDRVVLMFAKNTYTGTLASNGLAIDDSIKLSAGYAPGTAFILTGEFSEHFKAEPIEDGLTLTLLDSLPVEARERAFIVLDIEATRERAVSAWTSVVIEVVRQEIVPPVFDQTYYRGAYNAESGLQFTQVISLSQGYDDTVSFTLEGALISLFHLSQTGSNSFVISAQNPIPSDVLQAHSQFLFAVVATKPGAALVARSAVSIDIEKDLTDRVVLMFAKSTYTGTLASNGLAIDDSIKLSAGYAPGTAFILTGEFSEHFKAEPIEDGLTLTLLDSLPVEARERAFIVLDIEATRERAVSAWTSVVIEVVRQEIVPPVFDQTYYRGAYNAESGLQFTQVISLSQGYDDTVSFTLEGALISLFHLSQTGSNSFVISAPNPIPSDVLQAHSQFLFAVVATKPGAALVARSAVSIDIEKDLTDRVVLMFAKSTYTGTLASNGLAIDDSIKLSAGYAPGTAFILTGEFSEHFKAEPIEDGLTLTLLDSLPVEARERAFIVLDIEATRERAVSAWTSVVIEVVRQEIVPPVFDQTYYRGAYNAESGLQFTQVISLSQGYDDTVSFTLEGALISLFHLSQTGSNSFVISAPNPIPSDVLQAHSQFLFAVVATKPGAALVARSAVSIDIEKDLTDRVVLIFAKSTYTGTLASNGLVIDDSIKLSAGYAPGTAFILTGEFSEHFKAEPIEDGLTLTLLDSLPVEARERAFIVLDIEATRERAVSAWTSVVIEVVRQEIVPPVFDQTYYRGAYNAESGLQFTQVISLSQGYDDTVSFTLEGALISLFHLSQTGSNSFVISAQNPIPSDVLQAHSQFLFAVVATKPGAALVARSAVSIDIEKDLTDRVVLMFAKSTYTGTLASNGLAIDDSIKLSAGYAPGTAFILTGEFSEHFKAEPIEDGLTLTLLDSLPVEARERAFIVLDIEATRERAVSAWTSVVIEVVRQEIVPPVFDQTYYRGAYNAESGLQFTQVISLSQGYDDTVSFTLEGALISLFHLSQTGSNSFVISAPNPIPSDVLQAHNQFLFAVVATKPGAALVARSAVSIDIEKDLTDRVVLMFAKSTYTGTLASNGLAIDDSIKLSAGYAPGTAFILTGEFSEHFKAEPIEDGLTLTLLDSLPVEARERAFIVLDIEATRERAVSAWTSVVIEVVRQEIVPPVFDQTYYRGAYNAESGLQFTQVISLSQGYDDTVSFTLEGALISLFHLSQTGSNSFVISAPNPIPSDVLQAHSQFLFAVVATKPGAALVARSAVSIDIEKDLTDRVVLMFAKSTYTGTLASNGLAIDDSIKLSAGYAPGTAFILTGEFSEHFKAEPIEDGLTLTLLDSLPVEARERAFIVLDIEATRERAVSAWTSVVIEVVRQEIVPPVFDQTYYRGAYNAESGLQFTQVISLSQGYDDTVSFTLEGALISLFHLSQTGSNSFVISAPNPIPSDVLQAHSQFLFAVVATKPGAALVARSAVSIDIEKDLTDRVVLMFAKSTYTGTLASNGLAIDDSIKLSAGYAPGTAFILTGEFSEHFKAEPIEDGLTLTLLDSLPVEARERAFIVLDIEATRERAVSAWTSVVIEVVRQEIVPPVFDQTYYRGAYNAESGLQFTQVISLSQGYDDTVSFTLEGALISLFHLSQTGSNSFVISAPNPIPSDVLQAHSQFLFAVVATKPGAALVARSAVSIDIEKGLQVGDDVSFDRVLYRGELQLDDVRHDVIRVYGYVGIIVDIISEYSNMFEATVSGGRVTVRALGSLTLPADTTYLTLELNAASARAVLLLNVLESGGTLEPTVTFSSETYRLSVDITQTGYVGRVAASANTGEDLTYSHRADDAHLQTRLSINNEGELHLSAPANSGVYTFQVIATTVSLDATGTAWVHLTAQAVTVCEDKGIVMPPLIILERDEEAPHSNLVVLDSTQHAGCYFTLTNRWPTNQSWLYINELGLHTNAIDREHASIAFMALSQVQVELILHCRSDNDNAIRKKRSKTTERLGPYDYGSNKWILTDTIPYNSRRSLVNLIVNDINDNDPIFVGIEHQPIAVGYPTAELEERILPRSLAELQATDADIGENAALRYWSSETVLAVAPTTGFVHVRTGARLTHDQILVVSATDENGQGRTGTIQLIVKLLDLNHIAVVTIRDAFLSDETTVLAQLTNAIGYEVKALRSVVVSDDIDVEVTRNKREVSTRGASLQLYVYGIDQREAVTVDRLTADISANAAIASVVSTISLEDHLQDMNILDHQIGLLVATIILGVLLFVVILLVAIWFFLRWRKAKNHKEFHDESSISNNSSLGELSKPETEQPRLNIEDLRRSERRLQEMLQAPIEQVIVEPMPKKIETPVEAILDLPINEPSAPIVIQSIDKLKDAEESSDDEFGEVSTNRRKSVVTFNENVEKIIHVEDNADDDGDDDDASTNPSIDASNSGFEIYRL